MNIKGGYEEVRIVPIDAGRVSLRAGNMRLMDVVNTGNEVIVEIKPKKEKPIRVNAQELIMQLILKLNGPNPAA